MNINTGRIKELLNIYTKLDNEYQQELLAEAYKLLYKTTSKKQLKEDRKSSPRKAPLTEYEMQEEEKEIEEKAYTNIVRTGKMLDLMESSTDTEKAALYMIINRMKSNADIVKEEEISVQVTEKSISMKEYIEKSLPSADYNRAKEIADKVSLEEPYPGKKTVDKK